MTEETKEQLTMIFDLLKGTMKNADVGMGLTKNEIILFDNDSYVNKRQFDGIKIDVKSMNGVKI